MRIGSSSYSFKRLDHVSAEEDAKTLSTIIDEASEYGLAGLELLACQFESEDPSYINGLKQKAAANGLDLYALSLHNSFVKPDPVRRKAEVEFVYKWLDIAERIGVPIVRVFGGRWGTVTDFIELMHRNGIEEPLPGYRYEQAIDWNIECFKECVKRAEDKGIILAVENHWGLTYSAEGVLDIINGVGSEWLKVALDCGNFLENTYEQIQTLAPLAALVHAKSYHGGGLFYDFSIDYDRVIKILRSVGYNGYLSIEFEGKSSPRIGIPSQIEILSKAITNN